MTRTVTDSVTPPPGGVELHFHELQRDVNECLLVLQDRGRTSRGRRDTVGGKENLLSVTYKSPQASPAVRRSNRRPNWSNLTGQTARRRAPCSIARCTDAGSSPAAPLPPAPAAAAAAAAAASTRGKPPPSCCRAAGSCGGGESGRVPYPRPRSVPACCLCLDRSDSEEGREVGIAVREERA
jgi:hypothetical protein